MDLDERLAQIGLACAASLGASLPPPSTAQPATSLWEQTAPAYPHLDPAGVQADAARTGWRILVPGDREWPPVPPGVPDTGEAPWALWVRGDGDLWKATRRSVAVIGAHASTPYADHVAALLGEDLADRGWAVVTSCALGCDTHALAAAARGDTPPIAVYATALDLRACERREPNLPGLLVSDAPPDTPSSRHRSLARQDLLCYLSAGIVVVEAHFHSTTFAAVYYARRRGRLVMAVPGPITSSATAATHHLIRNHDATLVDSADAVSASLLAAMTAPSDPSAGGAR
ncbi:DNA-processing protein DprA [Frankia sp. ArI3]|nr:DNA-processing protein DprA [Frankia sp. ArI3]